MELPNYSLLDILNENMKAAGRKSYLHRVVYVFDHVKPDVGEAPIEEVLHATVARANESADEPLTGALLVYDRHGVSMVEGSEETVFRHFRELADSPDISRRVPRIKILLKVTHIARRTLSRWSMFAAQPQTLLERPEAANAGETGRRVRAIAAKLQPLWHHLRHQPPPPPHAAAAAVQPLSDRMTTNLPETARLEFVLAAAAPECLRAFVAARRTVQQPRLYQEVVWPPQKEFIPFQIFAGHRP